MSDMSLKRQKTSAETPFIEIIFDNDSFLVPKDILISQTVLSRLYEQELSDPSCEIIIIENQEPIVFKPFLQYLTTGIINPNDISIDMLMLSHEYLEEELKAQCETHLSKHFTQDNAIERLLLSVRHEFNILELSAAKFIAQNYKGMKLREDFNLVYDNIEAINAICYYIYNKLDVDIFSSLKSTKFRKVVFQISHKFEDLNALDNRCYFNFSYMKLNVKMYGYKNIYENLPYLAIGIENPCKNYDYICELKGVIKLADCSTDVPKRKFKASFLVGECNEYVVSRYVPFSNLAKIFEKEGSITVVVTFQIDNYENVSNWEAEPTST